MLTSSPSLSLRGSARRAARRASRACPAVVARLATVEQVPAAMEPTDDAPFRSKAIAAQIEKAGDIFESVENWNKVKAWLEERLPKVTQTKEGYFSASLVRAGVGWLRGATDAAHPRCFLFPGRRLLRGRRRGARPRHAGVRHLPVDARRVERAWLLRPRWARVGPAARCLPCRPALTPPAPGCARPHRDGRQEDGGQGGGGAGQAVRARGPRKVHG